MIEELFSKRKTTKKVIILKKYMDVRLNTIERNLQGKWKYLYANMELEQEG